MEPLLNLLDKLGFKTQKLRWKLYRWEQRWKGRGLFHLPARLHWLSYPNKVCLECGAVASRDARQCESCERPLPSMFSYRIYRLAGLVVPRTMQTTVTVFIAVMALLFVLGFFRPVPDQETAPSLPLWQIAGWSWTLLRSPGDYWRILASGLVHAGILHIGFNVFALISIGPTIEERIGRLRMLAIITMTQITSAALDALAGMALQTHSLTIGASGWLFGLIGFGIAYFHTMGDRGRMQRNMLMKWAGYALLFGFLMPNVANTAHIGGLIGGLALGLLPEPHPQRPPIIALFWKAAFWVSAALWLGTLAMLVRALLSWASP